MQMSLAGKFPVPRNLASLNIGCDSGSFLMDLANVSQRVVGAVVVAVAIIGVVGAIGALPIENDPGLMQNLSQLVCVVCNHRSSGRMKTASRLHNAT